MRESWDDAVTRIKDIAGVLIACTLVLLLFGAHFDRQLAAKEQDLADWKAGAHEISGYFAECESALKTAVEWSEWNEEAWR